MRPSEQVSLPFLYSKLKYYLLFIYLFSIAMDKNVHNTSTTIHIHETEQEEGTPQQFTPITVGPCKPFPSKTSMSL
jgi:hypothetical protein